jgi:DNA primase
MFPFRDSQGSLLGFAGRSIDKNNSPKYLNSPEFELFQKNSFFYGMFQAKAAIDEKKRIIVVEGYIDVIRMSERGLQEVVAVAGTAITKNHLYKLKGKARQVIFLFDGDEAGSRAAMKAAGMSIASGLDAKVAILPSGSDPDSFLEENSVEQMESLLLKAKDVLSYILSEKQLRYQRASALGEKRKVLEELEELGSSIEDEKVKNIFSAEVRKIFQFDIKVKALYTRNFGASEKKRLVQTTLDTMEEKLMKQVLQNLSYFSLIQEYLEPKDFQNPIIQRLLQRLFSITQEVENLSWAELLQVFRDDKEITLFLLSANKSESLRQPQGLLKQWIHDIKWKSLRRSRNYEMSDEDFTEQKKALEKYKMRLKEIEILVKDSPYARKSHFTL